MKNANTMLLVILILLVVAGFQLKHYYPLMPERMATNFGASMEADGWSAKRSFFTTYSLAEVGMLIILLLPVFLQKRIPTSMINMPHRDYWFAAERHEETWTKVAAFCLWMAAATLAFMVVLAELLFRANLAATSTPTLGEFFWWTIGGYLGVVAVGTIWFYRQFARIPRHPGEAPPPE